MASTQTPPTTPPERPAPGPSQRGTPMPAGVKAMIAVFGAIFIVSAGLLVTLAVFGRGPAAGGGAASALRPDEPVRGLAMPEFTATTQDGRTFTRADLLGKVTIADFMFTHCPFICPVLTARMKQVSRELSGTGVRFASMTVDPERDTPARLADYAREHEADTARWSFLHADAETVRRVVADSLKFELSTDPRTEIPLPEGGTMKNIVHPGHFVLLGPEAEVLGIYRASEPDKIAALVARARAADAALPARR